MCSSENLREHESFWQKSKYSPARSTTVFICFSTTPLSYEIHVLMLVAFSFCQLPEKASLGMFMLPVIKTSKAWSGN
jgi:hypothetical protein